MTIETFNMQATALANAAANGSAGLQIWPTNPPPADPVSAGALRLWQFGKGAWSRTEIFQSTHTVLTQADGGMRIVWGDYKATFRNATGNNGLSGPAEAVPQSNMVCVLNKDYAGNVHHCGTATSDTGAGGFLVYQQTLSFDGFRFLSRGITNAAGTNAFDTIATFDKPRDKFLIVGVGHTSVLRRAYIHNLGSADRATAAYVPSVGPKGVGIANPWYLNSYSRGNEISAFAQVDAMLTVAQWEAVCAWLSAVESQRGVPVY